MTEQSTPRPDDAGDLAQGAGEEPLGGLTVEDELTPDPEERTGETPSVAGPSTAGEPADDLQADEAHDFTQEVTRP